METRQIEDSEELFIVLNTLLTEFHKNSENGKKVFFPPESFILPDEKITETDKKKLLVFKTGEKISNFSFDMQEIETSTNEALRLLGVTLYTLVTGQSELSHESFILDGYKPLNTKLWPALSLLLMGIAPDPDDLKELFKLIDTSWMKTSEKISENPKPFVPEVKDVFEELSQDHGMRVISHNDVMNTWGNIFSTDGEVKFPPQVARLRYNRETIDKVIEGNKNGDQWMLVYYSGQNPLKMNQKCLSDTSKFPQLRGASFWSKTKELAWVAKTNIEAGYYFVNFRKNFSNKRWEEQEELIKGLGPNFERCHEFIVTEAVLSNFCLHNGEKLLEDWYHWGQELTSSNCRVGVGHFIPAGFEISEGKPNRSTVILGVVTSLKHDF